MSVEALQQHRANQNHKFKGRSVWEHALEYWSGMTRGTNCEESSSSNRKRNTADSDTGAVVEAWYEGESSFQRFWLDKGSVQRCAWAGRDEREF